MSTSRRDNFKDSTKLQIAKRAGWLCSCPWCRCPTVGSNSEGDDEINIGVAAHICAAAPRGPRYDSSMSAEERKSASNGIWLCESHAKLVDTSDPKFTVGLLREWKEEAQERSWRRVAYFDSAEEGVVQEHVDDRLHEVLRAAATNDLEIFRRSDTWAANAIPRTFWVDGLDERVSTSGVAAALATVDDLIVVAEPGMGKTTTMFQLAEAVLENGYGSPIVVPLGDWSATQLPMLDSILERASFRDIKRSDFLRLAANPGVLLLLDGWNELDGESRQRATAELRRLKTELPNLSLLIATRKQGLDVPIDGRRVSLPPLNEAEQLEIARVLRGDSGERLLDEAWRTPGVRELVTIPLYLTALLSLAEDVAFPTTKDDLLRQFISVHEEDYTKAEALGQFTHGLHERYLDNLGVTATRAANTTIVEATARYAISDISGALVAEGQIANIPEPHAVLGALVNNHILLLVGEPQAYSFQHQQIQEWYASHYVEQLMLQSVSDERSLRELKADVLDQRAWEESVLFACERLGARKRDGARGLRRSRTSCAPSRSHPFRRDALPVHRHSVAAGEADRSGPY